MDVCKYLVPLQHGGTLNSHRVASLEDTTGNDPGVFHPTFSYLQALEKTLDASNGHGSLMVMVTNFHHQSVVDFRLSSTADPTCRGGRFIDFNVTVSVGVINVTVS
ncbi:UNVERIFIED_CONTAM: hypothetical protein NCL1_13982 [Trichonephila clavipes]